MRSKVGILNFHYSDRNYGAVLQAAALENILQEMDYDAEHIDFIPINNNTNKLNSVKRKVGNMLRFVGLKKKVLIHEDIKNSVVFEIFRDNWITRTEQTFRSSEDLKAIKDKFISVIVGSDQVWRPHYTKDNSLIYFLSFLSPKTKRISYAASFGVDTWDEPNNLTEKIRKELSLFDAISVRESSGVKLCSELFSIQAEHVLDPTLLVNEEFFNKIIGSTYTKEPSDMVYYKLDIDSGFIDGVKKIAVTNNYSYENIFYKRSGNTFSYTSVPEWLLKIKNSKLVITDSFHCVCFSIIFNKPFIYYPNESRGVTRIKSLLEMLGLEDRMCLTNDMLMEPSFVNNTIDYDDVHSKLKLYRQHSLTFLKEALSK